VVLILAMTSAGCTADVAAPTGSRRTPPVSPSTHQSPPPAVRESAAVEASPASVPGRPYDADAVLTAMRQSRRPGGVPDVLETEPIAAAIADELWTWSGEPWTSLTVGGACGPERCSIDVAGAPAEAVGDDLYQLSVSLADGAVTVVGTELRGYPPDLEARLDAIARAGAGGDQLEGLALQRARWLPPPDDGRFVLAYRSGGEEGSPAADVTVDLEAGTVIGMR